MIIFIATRPHHKTYFTQLAQGLNEQSTENRRAADVWKVPTLPLRNWGLPRSLQMQIDNLVRVKSKRKYAASRELNSLYRCAYEKQLQLRSRCILAHYYQRFADEEITQVAVWNGLTWPLNCVVAAARARGKQVVHFENGLLPATTTMDACGVNFLNSAPRTAEFYARRSTPTAAVPRLLERTPMHAAAAIALPARYIFVPFQIETDTQILLFSPWLGDMHALFELLVALTEIAVAENFYFVVKEHPSSPRRHTALHAQHPRILFANGNTTQQLIDDSCGVMTINSTVGLETILRGKPLLVLGEAFYAIDGIAQTARDRADCARWLRAPRQPDARIANGLIDFLTNDYCIPGDWRNPDARHIAAVAQRFRCFANQQPISAQSIAEQPVCT